MNGSKCMCTSAMNLFEHSFAANILGQANHVNLNAFIGLCEAPDGNEPADEEDIFRQPELPPKCLHADEENNIARVDVRRVKRRRPAAKRRLKVTLPSSKAGSSQKTLMKSFKCDHCDESFNVQRNLYLHKTVHSDPPFYCGQCHKVYGRCSSFLGHIKTHYQNEMFACKYCSQTFAYISLYEHHLRSAHNESAVAGGGPTDRKPRGKMMVVASTSCEKKRQFKCEDCNKLFSRSSSLRRHERFVRIYLTFIVC